LALAPSNAHSRRANNAVFSVVLGLVLLPSLTRTLPGLVHGLPLWLATLALVNHRRVFVAIALPSVLCLPAVLYYQHAYRMAPGASLWLIILDSSAAETVEYLAGFYWPLGLWCAVVAVGFAVAWPRVHGPIFSQTRYRILSFAPLLVSLIALSSGAARGGAIGKANQYWRDSFPWSAMAGRLYAKRELTTFASMQRELDSVDLAPVEHTGTRIAPRTVVLVIGESARRDRHGIYGYKEPTTPLAERQEGLIAFSNAVTLYPQTVDSVPVIVAKRNKAFPSTFQPSLVKIFSRAGYRTAWLSNQAAMGSDDSPVSIYAGQADFRWFARRLSRYGSIPTDDALLPRFREQLAGEPADRLIVLHLFGSHEAFERRYPPEYALLADPYDNSIRYTDIILDAVISELAATPGENILVYVSDHGLKLGECDGRSEHYDAKGSYEIPLYVWASPSWRQSHRAQWAQGISHANAPVTTMSVFDTIIDMADLGYPQFQPELSLISTRVRSDKRLVHTFSGTVDYDDASNDEHCHLTSNL
jgi:heptose-I-phosphate ethanolaminephosphotransferase